MNFAEVHELELVTPSVWSGRATLGPAALDLLGWLGALRTIATGHNRPSTSAMDSDAIAAAVLRLWASLRQGGKPQGEEWTVLAGFVATSPLWGAPRVLSLASGNKCVGASKMCRAGGVVNDCHAEVLARRALLCFLLDSQKQMNF